MSGPRATIRVMGLCGKCAGQLALLAVSMHARADVLPPLDAQRLARGIFEQLIEIDTTDSAGSTTAAAEAMSVRLIAGGLPADDVQVLVPDGAPKHGNLVARLRGSGELKPILLLAHLDVVEARPEDWSVPPFRFLEREGYFYGRGTSDDKSMASIWVATLLRLKQEGFRPRRDLIVALTSGEESGKDNGVDWLVTRHRDLIDAAFALNEGGDGQLKNGKRLLNGVQAAEKVYLSLALEVHNRGGHSSQPRQDNAIYQLAHALIRLSQFEFPVRLNAITREFFAQTASTVEGELASDMKALVGGSAESGVIRRLSQAPYLNALMRTTCVATQLQAGHAENALPQSARAVVNCRLLPEDNAGTVKEMIRQVVNDPEIQLTEIEPAKTSPPSPLGPEIFGTIGKVTESMWPGVPTVPLMSTGATDALFLRRAGIPTYGVSGIFSDVEDVREHGKDERVGVKEYYEGEEFLYRLVKLLAR
jgi:acetylornithine deacetylase/succinyl-diaminopimelate desuccinylase-like protein